MSALRRHPALVEDELAGREPAHPEEVLLAAPREARRAHLDQEQRDRVPSLRAIGGGDDHGQVAEERLGDEALGAVQHPAAVRARSGRGLHPRDVGARAGLGLRDAADLPAAHHRGKVAALLRLRGVGEQHVAHELAQELRVRDHRGPARELLLGDAPAHGVGARAPVFRRHGHAEEVELRHALVEVPRELVRAVDLRRARPDLALGKLAAQVADLALGLGEVEVHGGNPRWRRGRAGAPGRRARRCARPRPRRSVR